MLQEIGKGLLSVFEEKYGQAVQKQGSYKNLKQECDNTRTRLLQEVYSLSRRGNLNLVIGILISGFGIVFLGWSVINAPNLLDLGENSEDLAAYYVPRTTFVLLIEIFSFFFLRLYRASLNDIKYFQNEITNIDLKVISIAAISMAGAFEALPALVQEMSKTERNFVLKGGESTIELEKDKIEAGLLQDIVGKLNSIVQRNK